MDEKKWRRHSDHALIVKDTVHSHSSNLQPHMFQNSRISALAPWPRHVLVIELEMRSWDVHNFCRAWKVQNWEFPCDLVTLSAVPPPMVGKMMRNWRNYPHYYYFSHGCRAQGHFTTQLKKVLCPVFGSAPLFTGPKRNPAESRPRPMWGCPNYPSQPPVYEGLHRWSSNLFVRAWSKTKDNKYGGFCAALSCHSFELWVPPAFCLFFWRGCATVSLTVQLCSMRSERHHIVKFN